MSNSGKVLHFPERAQIEEEAARWVVRLDGGTMTDADRIAFEAWRQTSTAHNDAVNRLRAFWSDMDCLAELGPNAQAVAKPYKPVVTGWMAGGLVAAASLLVAAIIGVQTLTPAPQPAPLSARTASVDFYSTQIGGQQRIPLSDGSIITLNTASQIEVRMTPQERSVRLIAGEAFFEVAHDASRPFSVYARDDVAVAVGTAFSVRLHDDGVEVIVSEGKVSFAPLAAKVEPIAFISAGQTATFSEKTKLIETVAPAEVDRKLSWREGKILFAGDPLSSVVADIARYTDIEIEIADPTIASQRVGGYFEVGEVDRMLEALEIGFDLHVEHVDDKHVRITRANP